jgi:hypothetical protein
MMKILTLISLSLLAGVAHSAPKYLECITKFDQPQTGAATSFEFAVSIDESNGSVTHTDSTGEILKAEGFFTANRISYQFTERDEVFLKTIRYQIDRNSLAVTRSFSSELTRAGMETLQDWSNKKSETTTRGTCKVLSPGKRKL